MEKKWISTEQMLEALKSDPDNEHEYTHYLGGCFRSTHWWIYDSAKDEYLGSTNWNDFTNFTESEMLSIYGGQWWHRDA